MHPKDTLWATYRQNVSAARRVRAHSSVERGGENGGTVTIVRSYEGNTCESVDLKKSRGREYLVGHVSISASSEHLFDSGVENCAINCSMRMG